MEHPRTVHEDARSCCVALQGLELSHALFPALGHNVAQSAAPRLAQERDCQWRAEIIQRLNGRARSSTERAVHAGAEALLEQFRGGEQPIQNLILAPADLVLLIWLSNGAP